MFGGVEKGRKWKAKAEHKKPSELGV